MPAEADAIRSNLGKYVILDRLGKGGMGDVFLGEDPKLARKVAIKVMAKKLTDDPQFVERFRREARAAAAVSHPNCTQIHELDSHEGVEFFVMEYVAGGTLADRLAERGRLAPAEALDVILQAARGLRGAARANLIHRDIKPSNILITVEGQVKLTDFGLAKALEDQSKLTRTDVILGTPHYVSPEQARGEEQIDFRSDIYSLGVTLYQALSGRLPFTATTPMGIMLRHINDPLPPLGEACPGLPPAVTLLVHRMLEKRREDRQGNYDELIAEIEDAIRATPADLRLETPAPPRRPLPPTACTPSAPRRESPSTPSAPTAVLSGGPATPAVASTGPATVQGPTPTPTPADGKTGTPAPAPKKEAVVASSPARSPLLVKPRGLWARFRREVALTWGLNVHPLETWTALEPDDRSTKETVKRGVRALIFTSILAFVLWGPGGIVVLPAFGLFHVLDLLFTFPAVALTLPGDARPDRFRASLAFVSRCWSANVPMACTPLGLVLIVWCPYVVWQGLSGYLRLDGGRRGLTMLFWCGALMARLIGVGIFLRIVAAIARVAGGA